VRTPEDEDDARPISVAQINQLEDLWKKGKTQATADDLTLTTCHTLAV